MEELEMRWQGPTFTDGFIFGQVMHDKEICRQVVELILGARIGEIQYLSAQEWHRSDPGSMGIVMDVYLRDEQRIINVEMQTGHKKDLPMRSRYYQSVADVSNTPGGAKYRSLPDNIIIFTCTFDPFDKNLPRHTFEFTCDETQHLLKLEDGSLRIFLNTKATGVSGPDALMQAFYHCIQQGAVESELTRSICNSITPLKKDRITRRRYVTWALKMADARYDGFDEGLEQGIEKGACQNKLETARRLPSMGPSPEQVSQGTSLPPETVRELMQGT